MEWSAGSGERHRFIQLIDSKTTTIVYFSCKKKIKKAREKRRVPKKETKQLLIDEAGGCFAFACCAALRVYVCMYMHRLLSATNSQKTLLLGYGEGLCVLA